MTVICLLQAQARECLFEKLQLQAREARGEALPADLDMCLDLAQESAQLAHVYKQLYDKVTSLLNTPHRSLDGAFVKFFHR